MKKPNRVDHKPTDGVFQPSILTVTLHDWLLLKRLRELDFEFTKQYSIHADSRGSGALKGSKTHRRRYEAQDRSTG